MERGTEMPDKALINIDILIKELKELKKMQKSVYLEDLNNIVLHNDNTKWIAEPDEKDFHKLMQSTNDLLKRIDAKTKLNKIAKAGEEEEAEKGPYCTDEIQIDCMNHNEENWPLPQEACDECAKTLGDSYKKR